MPTDNIDNDDYLESELAQTEQAEDIDLEAIEASLADKPRINTLRKRMLMSATKNTQSLPFLASVQLDMMRKSPLGLKELFIVWLEKGNNKWLNPLSKHQGLAILEEILVKYQGDIQVLRPFIALLKKLSEEGISPASFVAYVLLPRMQDDYDWRKWHANHLEALNIIADLIISAKNHPPFHYDSGGLSRDIVLVKYIGRPIARYSLAQLRDEDMLNAYKAAWQRISLNNELSIYFIRHNVLHFIYAMSGKINMKQLTAILTQVPGIERSFIAVHLRDTIKLKEIKKMSLYNYDISADLNERYRYGYHSLDFAKEVRAYLDIVKTLLNKNTGLYLCAYYVNLLRRYKDPETAGYIAKLVTAVEDRGGMHIYKWHTNELLKLPKAARQYYVQFITEHDGCDPEYTRVDLLFRNEAIVQERQNVLHDVENLGLQEQIAGMENLSYKNLFNAYISKHPENADFIADYRQQLLSGKDRDWTIEYIKTLDGLNPYLHRTLLRSVIRGFGAGWPVEKAKTFIGLLKRYGEAHMQKTIDIRTEFNMPVKQISRVSLDKDAMARKQVNLRLVEKIWTALRGAQSADPQGAWQYIHKQLMKLEEPLEKILEEHADLEKEGQSANEESKKQIAKNLAKKSKTIQVLETKKQEYTDLLERFNMLNIEQKFITALITAGTLGQADEEFAAFVAGLLLQRYAQEESIISRWTFLKEDISVNVLTYQQFTFLLNLLDTLFFLLREDKKIDKLFKTDSRSNNRLHEILNPYIITKKKQVSADALDAAAKKITGYAALQEERAKWQSILDKLETKDKSYFHQMDLYTSKTFIDSYYGDMGGICLSGYPEAVIKSGFFIQRLADKTDKEIIGMSVLFLSTHGFSKGKIKTTHFLQAFAFNPLSSVLSHCNAEQQLFLYLQFRLNMEKLAWQTKLPVVISGIDTFGIISNDDSFQELIRKYETGKHTSYKVNDAKGLIVHYEEGLFAKALVIIDPRGYKGTQDLSAIPSFYAHRELQEFDW